MVNRITKKILYEMYYTKEMGTTSIAKLFNTGVGEIKKLMEKYKFKLRSHKEACRTKYFLSSRPDNLKRYRREKHHNWKGGRVQKNGRWHILKPDHIRALQGYVSEEVLVAEILLGRGLKKGEIVAHINRNGLDNSPYNLYVCKDMVEFRTICIMEFDLPYSNIL